MKKYIIFSEEDIASDNKIWVDMSILYCYPRILFLLFVILFYDVKRLNVECQPSCGVYAKNKMVLQFKDYTW